MFRQFAKLLHLLSSVDNWTANTRFPPAKLHFLLHLFILFRWGKGEVVPPSLINLVSLVRN